LQSKLKARGWHKDAEFLNIFGMAHAAYIMPGWSTEARTKHLDIMSDRIKAVFDRGLFDAAALRRRKVAGLTKDLLLVMLYNRDARQYILDLNPAVKDILVETTLGTDDLETCFGVAVHPSPPLNLNTPLM
jgi:hypothetical protein